MVNDLNKIMGITPASLGLVFMEWRQLGRWRDSSGHEMLPAMLETPPRSFIIKPNPYSIYSQKNQEGLTDGAIQSLARQAKRNRRAGR